MSAAIEHVANDATQRAVDYLSHVSDNKLFSFATDVLAGMPLEQYMVAGTVEELLRGLAYSTIVRELHRRAEVRELENSVAPDAASRDGSDRRD